MVLVGISIEDGSTDGFRVDGIVLEGPDQGKLLNGITTIPTTGKKGLDPSFEDLEGLGAVGNTIYAITESGFAPGGDLGSLVTFNVNDGSTASKVKIKGLKGVARFGDDAGYEQVTKRVGYNVQGNDEIANGPIGFQFYKVKGTKVSKVGGFNTEFADGLAAVDSKGRKFIASDFETADGDGNELYQLNKAGKITKTTKSVTFLDQNGGEIAIEQSDSGLDFVNGKLYAVTDQTNQVFVATSGVSSKGKLSKNVTFELIGGFPPEGTVPGLGEYEGFAIVDIDIV